MPEEWTGELKGRMHNAGITQNELAAKCGFSHGYVSMLLRSKRGKRGQREKLEAAFDAILEEKYG